GPSRPPTPSPATRAPSACARATSSSPASSPESRSGWSARSSSRASGRAARRAPTAAAASPSSASSTPPGARSATAAPVCPSSPLRRTAGLAHPLRLCAGAEPLHDPGEGRPPRRRRDAEGGPDLLAVQHHLGGAARRRRALGGADGHDLPHGERAPPPGLLDDGFGEAVPRRRRPAGEVVGTPPPRPLHDLPRDAEERAGEVGGGRRAAALVGHDAERLLLSGQPEDHPDEVVPVRAEDPRRPHDDVLGERLAHS